MASQMQMIQALIDKVADQGAKSALLQQQVAEDRKHIKDLQIENTDLKLKYAGLEEQLQTTILERDVWATKYTELLDQDNPYANLVVQLYPQEASS